jgi:hypothetical protein
VPDPNNVLEWDRYVFIRNNPLKHVDPSGHCWGIASGIRGLHTYGTTCNNLDMALTNKWGFNHIVRDHWYSSGVNGVSRFDENIGLRQLKDLIGQAAGNINLWTKEGNSLVRIIDSGQKIGIDP